MAWDSTRLPPQSRIAIATIFLFCSAHAVQASAKARAPALEMILMSLVALRSPPDCFGRRRARLLLSVRWYGERQQQSCDYSGDHEHFLHGTLLKGGTHVLQAFGPRFSRSLARLY